MQEVIPENNIIMFPDELTFITKHKNQRSVDSWLKMNYLAQRF